MRSLTLVSLLCAVVPAAPAQPSETFEVASVKLGDPLANGTSYGFQTGAGLKVENATLKSIILYAYDIRDFQLSGATGWVTSERFSILAKGDHVEGPARYQELSYEQRKTMTALVRKRLQALLAERFQLAIHHETKELPIYALVVGKNGVKMKPTDPSVNMSNSSMGPGMFRAQMSTVDALAQGLASLLGRPVKNETALDGFYDFNMAWTPDAPAAAGGPDAKPVEAVGPTLLTAVQEQLGLKLETRKGPVDVIILDRAQRPSEN
jgi:uncharacterized protein (TIGR03435 family)